MGHGDADTTAYLVRNHDELDLTKDKPEKEDPVAVTFGSVQPWVSEVTGKPQLVKDEDVSPIQNIGGIFNTTVLSVLGDVPIIGPFDIYKLLRGMAYGPGGRRQFGFDPVYAGHMKGVNDAFNTRMGAAQTKLWEAEAKRMFKDKEDPLKDAKKKAKAQVIDGAGKQIVGIQEGADYYRSFPAGTPYNVILGNAQVDYRTYDGSTFRGVMEGIRIAHNPMYRRQIVGAVAGIDEATERKIEQVLQAAQARANRFGA